MLCEWAISLWSLPLLELERTIEPELGLFGSSFSEVIASTSGFVEGGVVALKHGLSKLRCIVDENEREAELRRLAMSADSNALDRLVHLAREQTLGDLRGAELGTLGEERLDNHLRMLGVDFVSEAEQRESQISLFGKVLFPTPDVLLRRPVTFTASGRAVRWLDAKATLAIPGFTMDVRVDKFKRQLNKYVACLGAGVVIWMYGYVRSLPQTPQVTYLTLSAGEAGCDIEMYALADQIWQWQ